MPDIPKNVPKITNPKRDTTKRATRQQRGYTDNYYKIRRMLLATEQLCRVCGTWGEGDNTMSVHHIDGNNRNNHPSNLAPVCLSCHGKITNNGNPPNITIKWIDQEGNR